MRIAMIGTGYVGLVSGACFSEFGVTVTCVDKDAGKIERLNRGEIPIYEPGLDELVAKNVKAGRLSFSLDLASSVADADAVFIAVGTPSRRGDGHADLSYVYGAAEEIARGISDYTVVVTKSTVPVGTGREVARIIRKTRPDVDFGVASNPEFLREGSAIGDFLRPDRVVIGTDSDRARAVMRALYRPLYLIETPIVMTSLETAELIKYAANTFLATKITFINEIADLCEKSVPTCMTWPRASALTVASARNSCIRGRAMAARASPRTRWRWSAPPRITARRCASSRRWSTSTTSARSRWRTGSSKPAAAMWTARRSPCSA